MKGTLQTLFGLQSLLLILLTETSSVRAQGNSCPPVTCADPSYSIDDPCPSCEYSQCKYRGCVISGAFGRYWKPDNCTYCSCWRGREFCHQMSCQQHDCHGFPTVTEPGKCCSSCDYGIGKYDCGVIPTEQKSVYVSLGENSCKRDVLLSSCDKNVFRDESGKWFQCMATMSNKTVSLDEDCTAGVKEVTYIDVVNCEKRELPETDIPQDYGNPEECELYIEP